MTKLRLLLQSILYYWRTNLAVLLGVVAGTAVIGGALVVGDSVRESLRQMSLERLGEIDHVLNSERFFREDLADDLANRPGFAERFDGMAPGLVLTGSVQSGTDDATRLAGRVNVYGVDERMWQLVEHGDVNVPVERNIVLNERVAEQLEAQSGDDVSLWIELPSSIPRDTLLGERQELSQEIPFSVASVLDEDLGVGRLDLNPTQQLPPAVFVSLETLQSALGLEETPPPRRRPELGGEPARVNTIFVSARNAADRTGATADEAAQELNALMGEALTLEDLQLRVRQQERFGYISLESERMILEAPFVRAAERTAEKLGLKQSPVFVYLANEIANTEEPAHYSMYAIVAGIEMSDDSPFLPDEPPFGPFTFTAGPPETKPGEGDIVLNAWLAQDLNVKTGDEIRLKYHVVGSHGELPEEEVTFTVRGIVAMEGAATDRALTPELEGITDAETFQDWDEPFPMQLDRVTARDEEYWDLYRATPKAFLALSEAQELWRSGYGQLTAFRVAPLPEKSLEQSEEIFTQEFLGDLQPGRAGLFFQPIKRAGVQAARGTTDFTGLFIGFSFFLILSATILIGLLFRLGIERRGTSVGLLAAVGFAPAHVRRLLLGEGLFVVLIGGLLGLLAACGYAWLMIYGLKTWWYGAIQTRFLFLYIKPVSLMGGLVISVAVATLAIWWALRQLRSLSTRALLAGTTEPPLTTAQQRRRGGRARRLTGGSAAVAGVLLVAALLGLIPTTEAFSGFSWQVVAFFLVGVLLLVACLSGLSAWLDSDRATAVRGRGFAGTGRLGLRNASRHRQRSVSTAALIASATFVITAVAAGHRNPTEEKPQKDSGNGGFTLVAETSQPILYDLNTQDGRAELDISLEDGSPEQQLLERMRVVAFRKKPGGDVSCLNLYRINRPTILGVPQAMIDRGGFGFIGASKENPWTQLSNEVKQEGGVPVYPAFGDMATMQYSLKKGVGDMLAIPSAEAPDYRLEFAGMLDGSVFQDALLISEENFRRQFPDRAGYNYFLIEIPPARADALSTLLESELTEYGFDAEPVAQRLQSFLAVQNTYLSTFQALGGLGLLLGTLGLATVMLRNVIERRSELALLRAVGFRNGGLAWLVLCENAFLLAWGLVAGTVAALLAMAPHLTSTGADVPWAAGGVILGSVFIVGMLAAWLAVAEAVRTPILETLRAE